MKNAKRWLAVILAVTLLGSNAIYQLGTTLSANETEAVTESQQDESENAVAVQEGTQQEDTGKATVQEVTPQEDKPDASAQEASNEQAQQSQPAQAEANTQEAAPANAGQSEPEANQVSDGNAAQAETPVAQTYDVKINKPELDGGQIKVWGTDGIQTDVTSYDGNNQYVKEVTEGEDFNFQITRNDGFEIENVTVNGVQVAPESTDGSVSTYKLSGVAEEKAITITYNKVETPAEENQDGEAAADEGIVSSGDAVAEQGGQQSDDKVNTASLNDAKETAETHEDTDTEKWITVGKSVTLSNEYISNRWTKYSHSWKIKKGKDVVSINASNSNSISVEGKKAGEATITDTIAWNSYWDDQQEKTITYTIHVSEAVAPTAITITGANEVTQFKNINLTYTLTPAGAEGTVQWSSSNEDILTVDSSGKVTGLRRGQATVTANVYSGQSLLCSATKIIQVVEDTTVAGESATVYYLLNPMKDANSNDPGNWGPAYGTAKVNVTGATWTNNRNCFDNVDQRVISWPNGTNVVTRNSEAWNQIFNNYKSSVEQQLGVGIIEDDVVSITLRPAKISRNNNSNPDKHLDCNVDVNCKGVSIVHYYLLDKSSVPNSTEYVHQGSKSYINGNKTDPETVTGKSFPTTKTGTDGATYTFSGWYTDQELTQPATFPYTVNSNVNFYAKYVAGRQVIYNLNGGSFSNGSALTEKHNEGENVVVKSEPTRKGYKFTGWTVKGLDGVSSINSGASFQMPNNNVTITANWEEQKIEDFITLTPTDAERVYNGESLAAGTATVSAKKAEANLDGVKIEYQKADGTWTENPAEITATNVADSTTVKVRVTSENYVGKLEKSEKLTITKRPVTISVANAEKYYGTEDPAFAAATMSGQVSGELTDVDLSVIRTNAAVNKVGTYEKVLTINQTKKKLEEANGNYTFTINPGNFEIKTNDQGALKVSAANVEETYDGQSHGVTAVASIEGATIKYKDANGNYTLDESPTRTEYGETTVEFKASLEGYADAYGSATIKINKRPVEIKAESASKTYGEEDPEFAAAAMSGQVSGELTDVDLSVSRSDAGNDTLGTHENVLNISQSKEELEAAYTNYTFTVTPADFTVNENKTALTVSAADVTKVYDGTSYGITAVASIEGATIKYKDKDGKYTLDASPVRKNVGETTVEFEASLYGYKTVTGKATIEITKRPVKVVTYGNTKVYDGKPLTAGGEVNGLVDGETVSFAITGTQTLVGSSNNTYTLEWNKSADKDNYQVLPESVGVLEVTPQSINPGPNPENPDPSYDGIQIDSPSDVEYDGQAHKWSPTVTDKNGNALTESTDYEVSYDKDDFTDVKTITVTIIGKGNYTGTVTRVYNILAAPLIIRTEKAEKTYDGKPLTNENMTIEGLKNGEVVVHKTTGSQTEVGNSDNTYELDWKSKETTAKESNYIIKEVSLGKLVVKETEDEIVVTTTGGTFTYDGQPHGATVEVSELPEGYTLQTAESDATATDVTTEAVTADADRLVIVNAAGVDVTANLKITRVTGEIVVNPATVTVTTPNASKVYDGTPLTAAGTITGLVNGETVSFATTGTITNVGTATNSYSLVWDQTAKATNYTVSENLGTLTVTAPANNNPSVTPTPPDNPRPNNPTRPSGQTTEPTGNAFVDNVVTPVVETVKEKAAKIQEVFNSDDEDVPLADQNLDNHKCCILHFLIMLITLLVYALATKSMKKRQKKLHEVREELDCELARRGLPLSREKE